MIIGGLITTQAQVLGFLPFLVLIRGSGLVIPEAERMSGSLLVLESLPPR